MPSMCLMPLEEDEEEKRISQKSRHVQSFHLSISHSGNIHTHLSDSRTANIFPTVRVAGHPIDIVYYIVGQNMFSLQISRIRFISAIESTSLVYTHPTRLSLSLKNLCVCYWDFLSRTRKQGGKC